MDRFSFNKKTIVLLLMVLLLNLLFITEASATTSPLINLDDNRSEGLQLLILLTVLALVPSILILMTGFTRIVIVLSFVRNALGLQQMPPNQVLIGLALILNFFLMSPILDEIKVDAYDPYVNNEISQDEAITAAMVPMRGFMINQTYKKDMEMFLNIAGIESVPTLEDIPNRILLPSFVTSEIKRAFQIGFFIFVPFLIIDMIVASSLMSMGMMMLPRQ